jgi:ABC-2 type transport system ATP-binding protein
VVITIRGLSKQYENGYFALDGIDLTIHEGMFGLLGPNGAGKSTLIRILVTLLKSTSGTVLIDGKDINSKRKEIREMLGYLPQDFHFFPKLKSWEFLDYSARLAGIKNRKIRSERVQELLNNFGLYEARNRMANNLSGGMKRRLGIAQALIGKPRIIIVDEPTTGLDPEERIRFRNIISSLSHEDIIIILSTHIVGDISSTCNQMALLNLGKVVYQGSPDKLVAQTRGHVWHVEATQEEFDELKIKYPITSTIPMGKGWEIQLVGEKPEGYNAYEVEPNLEHAYVDFMENKLLN